MSILATAGRAKIYNTDGTGRDTYVGFNSGGFVTSYQPAAAQTSGTFGKTMSKISPQHIARGGGQGSPGKTIHYHVNGTGRDSYIHANHGGFMSNYSYMNDNQAYVASLRDYPSSIQKQQRDVYVNNLKSTSPRPKDHFVSGQLSIRSPKAANELKMLKNFQAMQS